MDYATWDINRYMKPEPTSEGPKSVLPDHFCGLIVGGPGKGKTTLVTTLLKARPALYKKFDLTLFISPSEILELGIKKDRWSKFLSIDWIKDRIEYFRKRKPISNVLVFIDDCVSTIWKSCKKEDMTNFFFNRRKMVPGVTISIIVSTQKYIRFPSDFRSQVDWLIIFGVANPDLEKIAAEQSDNEVTFKAIAKSHWNNKPETHPFLFIRKTPVYKLFLNFEETA